ncbi:hypothetical protein FLLO111716_00600 [Flavobacterium longum]
MNRKFKITYYALVTLFTAIIAYQIYRLAVLVFPSKPDTYIATDE